MNIPTVKAGDWIEVKSSDKGAGIDVCVLEVLSEGEISVGYYQDSAKSIKEDVVWNGSYWKFKYDVLLVPKTGDHKVAVVKRGSRR